jgi:hypothetical protein
MRLLSNVLVIGALSAYFAGAACTANIHDNTVDVNAQLDFKVDSTVNVNQIKPGDSVSVQMSATGVVLVDPNTQPQAADVNSAAYFKIFLDDDDSDTPLVVTAQTSVSVKIPAATPPGPHKLICHLFKHDGTPTNTEQDIDINVMASASVTVGADAGH